MPKKNADQAHIRFTVDVVLDANGEDHDYLGQRMNNAFARAMASGALTGETSAEVDEQRAKTTLLTPEAAALCEDEVAAWLSGQIESGTMSLERLARVMARYALADPADMRLELVERMNPAEVVWPESHRG